jgi:hypothetical protein
MLKVKMAAVAAFGFAALGAPADAHAGSNGGICGVTYNPAGGTKGSYGSLTLSIDASGGSCSATTVTFFCTTGATSSDCDTTALYSEAAILSLHRNLVAQRIAARTVSVTNTYLGYGVHYKGKYVTF